MHDAIIDGAIRRVPDFPKPGILFYDITGILTSPTALRHVVDRGAATVSAMRPSAIAAVEARGFLFAAPIALALAVPLILVRKKGKLPGATRERTYDLEYGTATVEVHEGDVAPGARVVIVDDLIATGGTIAAAAGLIESFGAEVAGVFAVVGLPFLEPERLLGTYDVRWLQEYAGE